MKNLINRLWAMAMVMAAPVVSVMAQGYTLSPESGAILEDGLEGVIVAFDEASQVKADLSKITVTAAATQETYELRATTQFVPEGSIMIYFADYDFIEDPGYYQFFAEPSAFTVDGEAFDESIEAQYYVPSASEIEHPEDATAHITPAAGSKVDKLDHFIITFSVADWSIVNRDMIWVMDAEGETYPITVSRESSFEYEGYYMLVRLNTPITEPGEYSVGIGYQALKFNGVLNENIFNFNYTVVGDGVWMGNITVDPEEGEVESLHDFYITFEGATNIAVDEFITPDCYPAIYKYDPQSGTVGRKLEQCAGPWLDEERPGVMNIWINSTITMNGAYALIVPTNFVTIDGLKLAEPLMYVYTIGAVPNEFEYSCTFSPADGANVKEFTMMTVEFEGLAKVETNIFADFTKSPRIYRIDEDGRELDRINGRFGSLTATSIFFQPGEYQPIEEAGLYKFVIPAGCLYLYNEEGAYIQNEDIISYFSYGEYSGLRFLGIESLKGDVYNMSGVKVMKNASASELNQLAPGLYIFNNKKVLVR